MLGAVAVGAGGLCLFVSTRLTWVTAVAYDDRSGESTFDLAGSRWSPELAAVAAVLIVGFLAGVLLRRLGRRLVALLCLLVAAAAGLSPISFLSSGADPDRAWDLLTSNADSADAAGETISSAAQLTEVTAHNAGAILAIVGCVIAIFGAALLGVAPGKDKAAAQAGSKYDRKAARLARVERNLSEAPDSTRVMWDALDADIDPTDDDPALSTEEAVSTGEERDTPSVGKET